MAAVATESVLGLFKDPDSVANALDGLRAANFDGLDLKVLADTPYPEGAFGEEHEGHRLYVFPFIGAICGLTVGILLTIGTQLAYPMVTGGKPVLSIPPIVHILYEGTMLGAILFTVLGIVFESRLPDLSGAPYDPRISEGYLGVLVTRSGGRRDAAERVLRDNGAIDIITRDKR